MSPSTWTARKVWLIGRRVGALVAIAALSMGGESRARDRNSDVDVDPALLQQLLDRQGSADGKIDSKRDRVPIDHSVIQEYLDELQGQADDRDDQQGPAVNKSIDSGDATSENKSGVSSQALALPSGEGAIDGLGESFEPQLSTGTATFSLPIIVPPARGRVGPSLAFSYHSGGGQGIAGMGWSVGVPSIQRQTDKGLPRYDGTDRFVFNGEELVAISDIDAGAPPPSLSGVAHTAYRLKLEGRFWRFYYVPDSGPGERGTWLAQDKDGTRYLFGTTTPSRIENEEGVYRWNCSEVIDVHGNIAFHEYFADSNGQSYLIAVLYNEGADGSFKDRIGFNYEGRPDIITSYASGHAVRTVRRLASVTIDTEYNEGEARRRVRTYDLSYDPLSYHSLLSSIQLIGNDGVTAYPSMRFGYTEVMGHDTTGLPDPTVSIVCPGEACHGQFDATIREMFDSPDRSINDSFNDLLDINGDALPDLFVTDLARNEAQHSWVQNLGGGVFEAPPEGSHALFFPVTGERRLNGGSLLSLSNRNVQLLDIDGDGRVEMLHMPLFTSYNYYEIDDAPAIPTWRRCDGQFCGQAAGSIRVQTRIDFRQNVPDIRLLDVDNDHFIDVVQTTNSVTRAWLNLGRFGHRGRFGTMSSDLLSQPTDRALETCPLYKGGFIRFSDPRVRLGDMNGDGIQDIVLLQRGDIVYWPGRGYGSFGTGSRSCPSQEVGTNRHLPMGNAPFFSDLNLVEMRVSDVNGDNLADLIEVLADSVRIWLNEGGHAYTAPLLIERTPEYASFSKRVREADMNGSGSRDLVWGDATRYRYMDFTGGIRPRLLSRIENGLGKVTEIDWESTTEHRLRIESELEEDARIAPQRDQGWQTQSPVPTQVIARVTVRDQMDLLSQSPGDVFADEGVYVTEYSYFDPYYDGFEAEFRGFRYVEVLDVGDTNSPTSLSKTWFYVGQGPREDEALKGIAFRTEVMDAGVDSGAVTVLRTDINVCTVDELMAGVPGDDRVVRQAYSSGTLSYLYDTAAFDGTPSSVELTSIRTLFAAGGTDLQTRTYTLPGTAEAVTQTSTLLDRFGNEVESLEFGQVLPGLPGLMTGDERYTFTEWDRNEAQWVHRPTHSFVTGGDTSVRFSEVFYCYDYLEPCGSGSIGIGDLTREEALIERDTVGGVSAGGTACVESRDPECRIVRVENDHDAFGHVIRTVEGERQERRFDYGGLRDRFSVYVSGEHVVVSGPVTLSAYAQWEPGFGKIVRYEDYNILEDFLAFTTIDYDPLGRVSTITRPHVNVTAGDPVLGPCPAEPTIRIAYTLAQRATDTTAAVPVSSATVYRRERECDPDGLLRSVSYVDGLGRVRQTLSETLGTDCGGGACWIVTDVVTFDAKGGQRAAFQPFFWAVSAQTSTPGPSEPGQLIPQPFPVFQAVDATAAPFVTTQYDAFERPVVTTTEDGVSHSTMAYHALSEDIFDENDTDTNDAIAVDTPKSLRRDGLGRLVEVIERNRAPNDMTLVETHWLYRYDPIDDLVEIIDPAANRKSQAFDSIGRKIIIDDPNVGVWSFRYDNADNLFERIDGKGSVVQYAYDGAARMLSETYLAPDFTPFPGMEAGVQYVYDTPFCAVGDLACEADVGKGSPQGHLKGRLSHVSDLTGSSYFSYDTRGRVEYRTRHFEGSFFVSRMAYDALNRETVMTYPDDATVAYTYGQRGLLRRVSGGVETYVDNLSYNAAGQRSSVDYGDLADSQRTASYDVRLRPETLRVQQTAGPGHELLDEVYQLDRASNFTGILDLRDPLKVATYAPGIPPADRQMTYDALYQLVDTTGRYGTASYAYDELANLTHRSIDDGSGTGGEFFEETTGDYAYDGSEVLTQGAGPYAVTFVHKGPVVRPPPPGTGNFARFQYDDSGNMTLAEIFQPSGETVVLRLEWDALNRLVFAERVENGVPTRVRFGYDFEDARVFKRVEKSDGMPQGLSCGAATGSLSRPYYEDTTVYVDAHTEVRGCRLTKFVFASGRRITRQVTDAAVPGVSGTGSLPPYTFFYHPDHLGSVSTVTNTDGVVVNLIAYRAYGSVEDEVSGAGVAGFSSDYKYTDKELDSDTGLIFFGARYFIPHVGRWLSADPLYLRDPNSALDAPRQLNLYSYALNNPMTLVDPTGLDVFEVVSNTGRLPVILESLKARSTFLDEKITFLEGKNFNAGVQLGGLTDAQTKAMVKEHNTVGLTRARLAPGDIHRVVSRTWVQPRDDFMARFVDRPPTEAEIVAHELGHVYAKWELRKEWAAVNKMRDALMEDIRNDRRRSDKTNMERMREWSEAVTELRERSEQIAQKFESEATPVTPPTGKGAHENWRPPAE